MDWLQVVFLSIVQGLTEFLPTSSSAHLVLPAQLTDWPDQGLSFDVAVHLGTLLAVIVYFRIDLTRMAIAAVTFPFERHYNSDIDLIAKLAIATLPIVFVGLIAKEFIEAHLRSVIVIATATIAFGLLLWYADRKPNPLFEQHDDHKSAPIEPAAALFIGWHAAFLIGLAQVLALIPGTSRSGITITAALLLGLTRVSAARFSFLLAIPTILGAALLMSLEIASQGVMEQTNFSHLGVGILLSGVCAYLCIHLFIRLVEYTGMLPYVIYRLVLGGALFALVFSGTIAGG